LRIYALPNKKICQSEGSQRKPKVSKLKNICIRRHSQCSKCTE
jgi:hypothetical protein